MVQTNWLPIGGVTKFYVLSLIEGNIKAPLWFLIEKDDSSIYTFGHPSKEDVQDALPFIHHQTRFTIGKYTGKEL